MSHNSITTGTFLLPHVPERINQDAACVPRLPNLIVNAKLKQNETLVFLGKGPYQARSCVNLSLSFNQVWIILLLPRDLITGAVLPAISPAFVDKRTVKLRLAKFLIHVVVKPAKPLRQLSSAAGVGLISPYSRGTETPKRTWGGAVESVWLTHLSEAREAGATKFPKEPRGSPVGRSVPLPVTCQSHSALYKKGSKSKSNEHL